jgi:general secretion pathway protein A
MGLAVTKHLYENHFGLLDFPFSITPDPKFSYNSSRYREVFAKLRYGIEARKGFIVITGEVGTGKTSLIKAFMQSVESSVQTAFIFNSTLNFNQLLRSIVTDLGIDCSAHDRFTLMEKLNDYLMEQLKKDHVVVLLIDEAQDLSDDVLEELRLLSNLETERSRLIQIVLIGQPEFARRLDQPKFHQLKQRIALRCRLTPLPTNEVGSFINFRLKMAGYQGKELFDPRAVESIGIRSQGIPRLINAICDNALLIAYASAKRQVTLEMVEEVARDLKLTIPSKARATDSVMDFQRSGGRGELRPKSRAAEEKWFAEFQPFLRDERLQKPSIKRRPRLAVGIVVLVLMTVIGTVIYSQQNENLSSGIKATIQDVSVNYVLSMAAAMPQGARDYLSDLTAKIKEYSPQGISYLSDLAAASGENFQRIRVSFYGAVVKLSDHFPRSWDQTVDLAANAKASMTRQWQNLKQSSLIPKALHDSLNRDLPAFRVDTDNHPVAAEESPLVGEPSQEVELLNNYVPPVDAEGITETKTPELPAALTDEGPNTSATNSVERPKASHDAEPSSLGRRQMTPKAEQPSFLGVFEVVQNSFLRDKPESNAAITILQAGNRIRVESKKGDYFLVRSLDDPGLRGYVHREDAFFERIR